MRLRRPLIVMALAASVVAAGCSDGNTEPNDAGIRGMLGMLPASGDSETGAVTVDLYSAAAKANGLRVPKADADAKAIQDYALALRRKPTAIAGSDLFTELTSGGVNSKKLNGFDLVNVDADAAVANPPKTLVGARGRFDTSAVGTALRNQPAWKSSLKVRKQDGTTVYHWLDDNVIDMKKVRTGIFTSIGRSRRIALPDSSTFLYSPTDAGISALLDTKSGKSLADLQPYRLAADALDERDVYSAIFTRGVKGRATTLRPYDLLAVGVNDKNEIAIVVNADSDTAKTNADRLKSAVQLDRSRSGAEWPDLVGTPKITTAGRLTVMTVTGGTVRPGWPALIQEPLFAADS